MKEKIKAFASAHRKLLLVLAVVAAVAVAAGLLLYNNGRKQEAAAQQKSAAHADTAKRDAADLHIALMPTINCLPFYYAEEAGLFDKAGISVAIDTYASLFDTETAVDSARAAVALVDYVRFLQKGHRANGQTCLMAAPQSHSLIVCGRLRIKNLRQLRLHTLATTRFSYDAYLANAVMQQAGVAASERLFPQINDVSLRADMLDDNQIDAAILPEPQASVARAKGHRELALPAALAPCWTCIIARDVSPKNGKEGSKKGGKEGGKEGSKEGSKEVATKETLTKIRSIYDAAADSLNSKSPTVVRLCRSIMQKRWNVPKEVADTIRIPRFSHAAAPSAETVRGAETFLKGQK